MKHVSLNVVEELKKLLPETIEKNLADDEIICPRCNGLGVIKLDHRFGISGLAGTEKHTTKWFDNEYLMPCLDCYFGRIKTCKYCGKPLSKHTTRCDCEEYKAEDRKERIREYQRRIDRAKEIKLSEIGALIYDEESDRYFPDEYEFAEYYEGVFFEEEDDYEDFEQFFDKGVPKILWNCYPVKLEMSAKDIIESACEELYEDAYDDISQRDEKELQKYLDDWCKEQNLTTYYPDYKEYVKVQRYWFDR